MEVERRLAPGDWRQAEDFEPITFEKVIGLNNLLSISWLSRGLELASAVARIVVPGGVGSGFLIAVDLLITNHHVIPDIQTASGTSVEFNYQKRWDGQLEPVKSYELEPAQFRSSEELDYTIVRVKGSPGDLFGYVDLANRSRASVNDFVSIIQHPFGGFKQVSFTDNKVSAVFGDRLQYMTDTEPGSSGSPVFNQQWQIVGLHHAGGGLAGPDGKKYFTNEGMLIDSILRDASSFLGLPDALYDLAFSDLRGVLVHVVEDEHALDDPLDLAAQTLHTKPRFGMALEEWAALNIVLAAKSTSRIAMAGVAVGAALRQWARKEGHEAIAVAAPSKPPPSKKLNSLIAGFNGTSELPSDVYNAVLSAVAKTPALVEDIGKQAGSSEGILAMSTTFLLAVSVGARAYDAPRQTGARK